MAERKSNLPISASIQTFPSIRLSMGRARSFQGVTAALGKITDTLNNEADEAAIIEADRAGSVAGVNGKPTLTGENTLSGKAFDKAARQSYATNIELMTRTRLGELAVQHATNPAAFNKASRGYLSGVATEVKSVDTGMAALFEQKFAIDIAKQTQSINGVFSELQADDRKATVLKLGDRITKDINKVIPGLFSGDTELAGQSIERIEIERKSYEKSFFGTRSDGLPMFDKEFIAKKMLDFDDEVFQQIGRGFVDASPDKGAALEAITNDAASFKIETFDDAGNPDGSKTVSISDTLSADGKERLIGYLNKQVTAENRAVQADLRATAEEVADLEIAIADGSAGIDEIVAADERGLFDGRQQTRVTLTKAVAAKSKLEASSNAALDKAGRDEKIADLEIKIDNGAAGLEDLLVAERGGLFKGNPAKRTALRKQWQTKEEARLKVEGVLSDAEIADDVARQIADLDIAIKRGDAGEEDIAAADAQGLFADDQGKRASLTKAVIARDAAAKDLTEGMTRVSQAVNGEIFLDPKNADDKKFADAYYRDRAARVADIMQAQGQSAEATETAIKTLVVNMAATTGIVPKTVKGQLVGAMRVGDVNDRASAADLIDRLNQIPGYVLADEMPKRDLALGLQISALVRAGRSAEQAVQAALASTDPANKPVIEARNAEIKTEYFADNYEGIVSDNFDPFGPFNDAEIITEDGTKARLIDDYKTLFEDWYRRTGDADLAESQALIEINNVWGVTKVDSSLRVMKYAPEAFYGIGASGDDADWMRMQLVNDIKTVRPDLGDSSIILGTDNRTAREAKGRAPTYPVLIKTASGAFEPLRLDGDVLRWNPDSQNPRSLKVADAIKIAREARQEEIADKARLGDGSFGMLSEDIQRRVNLEGAAAGAGQ